MNSGQFWAKALKTEEGCWLWSGAEARDYGQVWFQRKTWRAHRLAYFLTYGPIPDGLYVLHSCDTPLCVRPDHLFLGTQSDNMKDMYAKGRRLRPGQPPGERHAMARLTEKQVRCLHQRLAAGEPYAELAVEYGVHVDTLTALAKRRSWSHLGLPAIPARQGSGKPSARLTEEDIPAIILRIRSGDTIGQVARDYGVGRTAISDIWHGKKWKHVPRPAVRTRVWES